MAVALPEDTYGTRKRMAFIETAITAHAPRTVLDVGCGVGNVSLSVAELFPGVAVTGIDSDRNSIEYARRRGGSSNVRFLHDSEFGTREKFDFIIASEVLEHVEQPERFLRSLRERLNAGGHLLVTVPNGYGPFEFMSLAEGFLRLSGVYRVLRALRRATRGATQDVAPTPDTLAISPHVNFFSFRRLQGLFARTGFQVHAYQPRTLLCGFLLDHCIRGRRLIEWNASVTDRLPPFLSSDWMFLLAAERTVEPAGDWSPGLYGRLHRYVNQRCASSRQ